MNFFTEVCVFSIVLIFAYLCILRIRDIFINRRIKRAKEKDPNILTFNKFCEWANHRAMDGCWSFNIAAQAVSLIDDVNKQPKKKRDVYWENNYAEEVKESLIRIYGTDYMHPNKEKQS